MKVPPYLFVRRLFYPLPIRSDFRANFLRTGNLPLTFSKKWIFRYAMKLGRVPAFRNCAVSGQCKTDRPDSAHGPRPLLNTSGIGRRRRGKPPKGPAPKRYGVLIRVSSSASNCVRAHGETLHGALAFGDAEQAARSNPAGPSDETSGRPAQEKAAAAWRPGGPALL